MQMNVLPSFTVVCSVIIMQYARIHVRSWRRGLVDQCRGSVVVGQ